MEETLTAHEPEGEVVGRPADEEEARAVVDTGASARSPDCFVSYDYL